MTPLTAAATAAVLIGAPAVAVVSVWPVAGVINTRRDRRDHAAVTAFTEQVTASLVAQVQDGVDTATAAINNWGRNPAKIALRAYRHVTAVDVHLLRAGQHDHAALTGDAMGTLDQLTNTDLLGDYTACRTPLANAAAAKLLLIWLVNAYPHGTTERGLVDDAIGNLAAATDALPNGQVLSLTRLGEHDPYPLHAAHAAWRTAARDAGIIPTPDVPEFNGDVLIPVTAQTAPVYPPGHRLAHTNAMDTNAALEGAR